jgi:hypothetical protein
MHAAIHARIFVTYIYMSIWHVHGTERLSPPVSMVHSCMACACDDAPHVQHLEAVRGHTPPRRWLHISGSHRHACSSTCEDMYNIYIIIWHVHGTERLSPPVIAWCIHAWRVHAMTHLSAAPPRGSSGSPTSKPLASPQVRW